MTLELNPKMPPVQLVRNAMEIIDVEGKNLRSLADKLNAIAEQLGISIYEESK